MEEHARARPAHCLPLLPAAQVEVLSAALRASCLDAHEETGSVEKSDLQDEPGINELPNCKLTQDDSVPLICDAVEVTNHEVLTARQRFASAALVGMAVANHV